MSESIPARTNPPAALIVLTLAYAVGIALVTLHPWQGWLPWSSLSALALAYLVEPWPRYWTAFDFLSNLLAYLPLGALLAASLMAGRRAISALMLSIVACALMSLTLETLQILLPGRVPSRADWVANVIGAASGALLAGAIGRERISRWPDRLRSVLPFAPGASAGLLLLGAWFAAQLYPQSMTFATGELLDQVALWFGPEVPEMLMVSFGVGTMALAEALGVAFTVVAVGLIVVDLLSPGSNPAVPVGITIALAALVKSAASAWLLGSGAALVWLSAGAQGGILVGALAVALLVWLPKRWRLMAAVVALLVATVLFNIIGPNPYFHSMMALWDQGRWVNLNGLWRGTALAWPFAAILYCLLRASRPQRRRRR
ncbi:MAG: VanZ family protein [Burkholderiaceae bacterium]|nr:VanZ family protein [Burkholderiaceae bacterium]